MSNQTHRFRLQQAVEVYFPKHDGTQDWEWRTARIERLRESDLGVSPGCARVILAGTGFGYDIPLERIRPAA